MSGFLNQFYNATLGYFFQRTKKTTPAPVSTPPVEAEEDSISYLCFVRPELWWDFLTFCRAKKLDTTVIHSEAVVIKGKRSAVMTCVRHAGVSKCFEVINVIPVNPPLQ